MVNERRFLAVIPARGGSKSVLRKNIRPLAGRPLLLHTLEQVAKVDELDVCVVSTDDTEIASFARNAGTRTIQRPAELATDSSPTELTLLHALDMLEGVEHCFDYIMVLEPTSPFRRPETIIECMRRIVDTEVDSLMTVYETRSNIGRIENDIFKPLVRNNPRRRQERQPFYIESSTVYVARVDFLLRTGSLVSNNWLAVIIEELEAMDINSEFDFDIAEALMKIRSKG